MSSNLNSHISKTYKQLKLLSDDLTHGASWLSIQAMNILKDEIADFQVRTISELLDNISIIVKATIEARPNMISIRYYVMQFWERLFLTLQDLDNTETAKDIAINQANVQIINIENTAIQAAINGANIIDYEDSLLLCSFSNTVCKALEIAKQRQITFDIFIAESNYNNLCYGKLCADQLNQLSIQNTLISDNEILIHIQHCNKVLVGADTILFNGSVINGYPSYRLAQSAATAGIPFYIICEISKIDLQNHLKNHIEPVAGFDLIPQQYISGIVTETGLIKPREIATLRMEKGN